MAQADFEGGQQFRLKVAATFGSKLIGLLINNDECESHGMLLLGCNKIHTFGMASSIYVLMFDESGLITKTGICKPNRVMWCIDASHTIELLSPATNISVGSVVKYLMVDAE